MYLGDNLLKQGIKDLVTSFRKGTYDAGISLQRVSNPKEFGIAYLDKQRNVERLVEKPDEPESDLALVGIYVFSNRVFDVIEELEPSWRGELEITDAIQGLIDSGCAVDSHIVKGWWNDTGRPEDIVEANRLILEDLAGHLKGTVEAGAEVRGTVDLRESSRIESGAVVRGPVSIARGTTISSGTYVGPYTSVGPSSTIGGTHIENSVVVGDSIINADVKIIDSLLGRGTTIQSADSYLPKGKRLVVGENSDLNL
jgi:glucose-1-phosphate thymidylyltransferase